MGVFDSGIGGLSVLRECAARLAHENFVYLADKANMPYGTKSEADIKAAALNCADILVGMNCKAIVIACNTATETAIDYIRDMFKGVPVVGLEPAVKPCLRELESGYGVALVTEATSRSERFKKLVKESGGRIVVAPQPRLAKLIEESDDKSALRPYVEKMLEPYRDAEAVALGCSHYSFISDMIKDFYGGKIKIYDGASGAAARLAYILQATDCAAPSENNGSVRFYSTTK